MERRIVIIALVIALAAVLPLPTHADVKPFDAKAFADAQAAGRSIVVAVNADW